MIEEYILAFNTNLIEKGISFNLKDEYIAKALTMHVNVNMAGTTIILDIMSRVLNIKIADAAESKKLIIISIMAGKNSCMLLLMKSTILFIMESAIDKIYING